MGEACLTCCTFCAAFCSFALSLIAMILMLSSTNYLSYIDFMPVKIAEMDWQRNFITGVYKVDFESNRECNNGDEPVMTMFWPGTSQMCTTSNNWYIESCPSGKNKPTGTYHPAFPPI